MKTKARNTNPNDERTTAAWLRAPIPRWGWMRVQILGWGRLAALWVAARPGGPVRRTIAAECRRCGYRPTTILALHAEE